MFPETLDGAKVLYYTPVITLTKYVGIPVRMRTT